MSASKRTASPPALSGSYDNTARSSSLNWR
jgi:hypothetical protein